MKNIYKILFGVVAASFLFGLIPVDGVLAGQCQIRVNFQVQPNPVPVNGTLNMTGYFDMSGSVWEPPGSPDVGYCKVGTTVVKAIAVQFAATGGYSGLLAPNKIINLEPNRTVAYGFSDTFKPADQRLTAGNSFVATIKLFAGGSLNFQNQLSVSTPITVNVSAAVFGAYGCLTQNAAGQNVYACSPTNNPSCSDVPSNACQGKPCVPLGDSRLCTGSVAVTHKECRNNACVIIPGVGTDRCATNTDCAGGGDRDDDGDGGTTTQEFEIENPIGIDTFEELVSVIGRWIFNLAIPIAVIIIIYAGVLMLTSGGDSGQFKKGMIALKYAVLGLAVVLIGKGFVTLIQSILSLRDS